MTSLDLLPSSTYMEPRLLRFWLTKPKIKPRMLSGTACGMWNALLQWDKFCGPSTRNTALDVLNMPRLRLFLMLSCHTRTDIRRVPHFHTTPLTSLSPSPSPPSTSPSERVGISWPPPPNSLPNHRRRNKTQDPAEYMSTHTRTDTDTDTDTTTQSQDAKRNK